MNGLAGAAGAGALVFLAHRSVYYPMKYPAGDWQEAERLGVTEAWMTTSDSVRIHGWYKQVGGSPRVTLFLHGNAGNVSHRGFHMRGIMGAGSSVLVLDYRGYGRSEGWPTEGGLYRDADAAYEWLLDKGWKSSQIVLHGESLGSAVAVETATKRPCAGIVLEAPFTSTRDVAATILPVAGPLLISGYDSKAKISRIRVPLLVIHGDSDEVIDYRLGKALYEAAPEPKTLWTVRGAGHNDLVFAAGPAYAEHLGKFYATLAK